MPAEKSVVQKTRVDHQGKLANVCGLLWLVEQKQGRNPPFRDFHVLTMEDGVEIISWHTSPESREQYLQTQGHSVRASVKVAHARGQTFFYLQSLQIKCECHQHKEEAEAL